MAGRQDLNVPLALPLPTCISVSDQSWIVSDDMAVTPPCTVDFTTKVMAV
jgi:hypothetical protein